MESIPDQTFVMNEFLVMTVGIVVYFVGVELTRRVAFLRNFNIPEPVTGGILASLAAFVLYLLFGLEISFELSGRDRFLVYFFTCIGLNARISDLIEGGKPLLILLGLTLSYIVIQDLIGIAGALATGQSPALGILAGSASLIGGHGTAIAWSPTIGEKFEVTGALEIGMASATLGLILASLLGGPIAKGLLRKFSLAGDPEVESVVGISHEKEDTETINHISLMKVILVLHVCIIVGYVAHDRITGMGLQLPLFVPCLLVAILLSNTIPRFFPRVRWPARTRALAMTSDFCLGLFLAMSLMSMQLQTLAGLAGPLLIILGLQVVGAVLFIRFLLFPLMGKDYLAAVLSAGFAGFSLGATPTAVANMSAVTKTHGPAPTAFIILPLVGAFFVDITNAFVIQFFLDRISG